MRKYSTIFFGPTQKHCFRDFQPEPDVISTIQYKVLSRDFLGNNRHGQRLFKPFLGQLGSLAFS